MDTDTLEHDLARMSDEGCPHGDDDEETITGGISTPSTAVGCSPFLKCYEER